MGRTRPDHLLRRPLPRAAQGAGFGRRADHRGARRLHPAHRPGPLACAAALAVIEVMQKDNLINAAEEKGAYLINALKNTAGVKAVRGRGLMIGFEMEEGLEDLRKVLLNDLNIFTGEAKPNVIRLLPSLAITRADIDLFLNGLQKAIALLQK